MDIIGNEVTQRIRAAITNKLKEVGVYVDDELPDYIMVMVANKKSKEQMMSDLMLFLGTNTKSFTIWLHELLDNLQATTSVETSKVKAKEPSPELEEPQMEEKRSVSPPVQPEDDSEEVITFQTELETDDILMQELQKEDMLSERQKGVEKKSNKISLKNPVISKSPERHSVPSKAAVKVRPIFHRKTAQSPLHRPVKTYDSYLSNDEDEESDDKYDPGNPSINSLSSVVRVSQRKSSVPRELQANKLLLFKAMADANKSVNQRKTPAVHVEPYEPTPISKLKKPTLRVSEMTREILEHDDGVLEEDSLDQDKELVEMEEQDPGSIRVPISSTKVPLMPLKRKLARDSVALPEMVPKNPRFVVTLDGVDPSEFLSPKSLRSVVSQRDVDLDVNEEDDEAVYPYEEQGGEPMDQDMDDDIPAKRSKAPTRCLKWPACPHGDECHFHHPKHHCKVFPNCTFGNKCLFIHPNCKYDSFCKKRDCPYTHAGKRRPTSNPVPIHITSEIIPMASNVVCKFHPDCLNTNCTFFHPKNCKFGLQCKNPSCQFTHPVTSMPSPHQLKWTAPKVSTSNRKFATETTEHMPISIDK